MAKNKIVTNDNTSTKVGDTTSLSVIDSNELDKMIDEDIQIHEKNHSFGKIIFIVISFLSFVCSFIFFVMTIMNHNSSIASILSSLILILFSITYFIICYTSKKEKKMGMILGSFLLFAFFMIQLFSFSGTSFSSSKNYNFVGKSITDAVKWANKNKIKIVQEYEYSDMVPEYYIISQSLDEDTSLDDVDEVTFSISEGPNPYKEIIIPSMLTWNDERVLNYIKANYLSNVDVEFVESDQLKDTVIEQSKSGNLLRNEELKLVFSYGDEGNSDEVSLIDFTNMSKFEIEFFLKQHHLNYSFEEKFSKKVKKGYGLSQSIAAGEVVKVEDEKIIITISKGPEIEIPELKDMSLTELTEWAIEKRLKLEFIDQYDDTVKSGKIISLDKKKGDKVEQGSVIKVYVSLGSLKMPKFKTADEFYAWADKYEIKYEVRHEFHDSIAAGEIIEFSYKSGQTLKNDDAIVITISDGQKKEVPNLKGYTKSDAISALKKLGLNYNFVYKNSDTAKDKVLNQSISAGSEVSSGTTITITLSNGKGTSNQDNKSTQNKETTDTPSSNEKKEEAPAKTCNPCTITGMKNVIRDNVSGGYLAVANALISHIEGQCPGIDVQVRGDTTTEYDPGMFVSGFNGGNKDNDGKDLTSCSVVHIFLAK